MLLGTGTMVDALSYEGSITTAVITGFAGTYNLVETSPTPLEDSGATDPLSLIRHANGQDSNNAGIDWKLTRTPTPGAPNILTPRSSGRPAVQGARGAFHEDVPRAVIHASPCQPAPARVFSQP